MAHIMQSWSLGEVGECNSTNQEFRFLLFYVCCLFKQLLFISRLLLIIKPILNIKTSDKLIPKAQTHQEGAPADGSNDHDEDELNHHLYFVLSAALGPVLSAAHLDQGHNADRVQQKGHGNGHQPDQREEQGEGQVISLWADVEKTPGARHLHVVASKACQGQQSYRAGDQPHHRHHADCPALGYLGGAREGTVDAHEALRGHGGTKQQWTQSIEDHGYAHEVAEVAFRI